MSQSRLGRSPSSSETKCNDKIACGNMRSFIPLIVASVSVAAMIGFAIAFAVSYSSVSMLSVLNHNSFENDDYITRSDHKNNSYFFKRQKVQHTFCLQNVLAFSKLCLCGFVHEFSPRSIMTRIDTKTLAEYLKWLSQKPHTTGEELFEYMYTAHQ